MNFILYLLIVIYLCLLEINCRSVQIDDSAHSAFHVREDKNVNHDSENSGKFSWKRLKPILRKEVQRIRNIKGDANRFNQETAETSSIIPIKEDQNFSISVDKNNEDSLKVVSQITNVSSIKSELAENNLNEDPNSESVEDKEFASNVTRVEILQLDHPLVENDFPDKVISDILNQSSDSILLQALNDNSSNIDSFEFDETSLLSEGGHIATLQEVSTIGFELLIDSETKRNSLLAELLSSSSNVIDDDDFSFVTLEISYGNESELQETTTDEEPMANPNVTEFGTDKDETENTELRPDEVDTENADLGPDEVDTEDADLDPDEVETGDADLGPDKVDTEVADLDPDEVETEDAKFGPDEVEIKGAEIGLNEVETGDAEFGPGQVQTEDLMLNTNAVGNTVNKSDSAQHNITENEKTELEDQRCPDPGWCLFWFLALDTCAKDSHCHGSLICCMIGCSKTCVDADNGE